MPPPATNPDASPTTRSTARTASRSALAFLAALAMAVTAACSEDKSSSPTADESVGSSRSTSTQPQMDSGSRDRIESSYRAAVREYLNTARDPNPEDGILSRHRSGRSLQRARDLLASFKTDGVLVHYPGNQPPTPTGIEVELHGSDAIVTACLVDTGVQVRAADGVVVNDRVVSQLTRSRMVRFRDTWKMDSQDGVAEWMDGLGCNR